MPMKRQLTAAERQTLPTDVQALYVQVEGKEDEFRLDVEASDAETKLPEFRENNRKLNADREKWAVEKARFEDQIAALQKSAEGESKQKQTVEEQLAGFRKETEQRIRALESERDEERAKNARRAFHDAIVTHSKPAGLHDGAEKYLAQRAESDGFKLEGDKLTRADGTAFNEYLDGLRRNGDSFLFKPSTGGGAKPGVDGGSSAERVLVNPKPADIAANLDALADGKVQASYTESPFQP